MGRADERLRAAKQPMYRSVGAALQDLAVAELAYEHAIRLGLATELPMEFYSKR